jgi:two-component system, chemotaxis family, protein-glutamate methylesterase/glutaminase
VGSMALAMERVRDAMIPKIKALVPRGPRPVLKPAPIIKSAPAAPAAAPGGVRLSGPPIVPRVSAPVPGTEVPVGLVAIGASTGGPNALSLVLPKLRRDFPVPVVVVQHMLPTFTHHFALRLDGQCALRVLEPKSGDPLKPGFIYIAPGDFHLVVSRRGREGFATLNQGAPENFCRPAVDVMFDSAASSYGASVLGVVLTGMGQDGYRGATLIRQAGGNVIVQDEATSVVWGMPGYVANAGLATQILPIERVAGEIERLVDRLRSPRLEAVTSR